ncbi:MAG: HEPN domain-containing protein [bacterium]
MKDPVDRLTRKKREATDFFIRALTSGPVGEVIAKVYLFGGLAEDRVTKESDIDLFIVAFNSLRRVAEECDSVGLETVVTYDEMVQPIVGCIDELRSNSSYFHRKVIEKKREMYSISEEKIKRGEAREFLELAGQYYRESCPNLELGNYRLLIDGAYNTVELCLKGFLILKGRDIPSRHNTTVQQFSRLYIKTEEFPREVGRKVNRGLRLRNEARYERHREVTREDATSMLELARELLQAPEERLM